MKNFSKYILLTLLFVITTNIVLAADNANLSVEERLNRLERLVNSNGLVDVMVRVESMQSELQRLEGEIEVQKHTLDEIKKRQRDLYLDIDRRLLQIERRSGTSTAPAPAEAPSSSSMNTNTAASPAVAENPAPVMSSQHPVDKEGEQVAYQKAFDLLRALRYDKATEAFRQFLKDYPNGRYAHIAQYWLAETSYHTRKYTTAVKDYRTLIEKYPRSPKRADALLKIGYSEFELKSYAEAKDVLEQLIQAYPGTTEAGQAENLLQKIRVQNLH